MKKTVEFNEAVLLRSMREALAHARGKRALKIAKVSIARRRKRN